MRRLLLTSAPILASLLLASAMPVFAQDTQKPVAANVWATTDYVNRGVSRSDGPALQGRLQLNHPTGIFGGIAGSTVDLNTDPSADIETVLFGGYQSNYADIDYNAKLSYYTYLGGGNDDEDYWEFALTGGYDFGPFYASGTWAFSPNYINDSGMSLYYGADVAVPLPYDLKAKGHAGFQFVEHGNQYIDNGTMDWGAGLWYNYAEYDVDIGLQYTDTNAGNDNCAEECGSRAALILSKDLW